MKRKVCCVIPARLGSTRMPNKMLSLIGNKPLLQWTYENVKKAHVADEIYVACDATEIADLVESFGGKHIMTRTDHQSGTSRIAEALIGIEADIILNVQGDEPMLDHVAMQRVADYLVQHPDCPVATLAILLRDEQGYHDPNKVKVVIAKDGKALYFSRASIPYDRERISTEYLKHVGFYGYQRNFLLNDFPNLSNSELEEKEKLEQLRILEAGHAIQVLVGENDSLGVDTEEDRKRVEKLLKERAS